jgi:hypothetical protein
MMPVSALRLVRRKSSSRLRTFILPFGLQDQKGHWEPEPVEFEIISEISNIGK